MASAAVASPSSTHTTGGGEVHVRLSRDSREKIKSSLAWHGRSLSDVKFLLATGQWKLLVPYAQAFLANLCVDADWMESTVFADQEKIVAYYRQLVADPIKEVNIATIGNIAVVIYYGIAPYSAFAKWIGSALATNEDTWQILKNAYEPSSDDDLL